MHRFFAPDLSETGSLVSLPAGESTHLTRVLRLGPGDIVALFDGRGRACQATIDAIEPAVRLRMDAAIVPAPEVSVRLTLAPAVLKGDGLDGVVRDGVMLGVAALQPVVSARTEIAIAALERRRRRERWERIALSSVKQCGRAVLPAVAPPVDVRHLLASAEGLRLMLVEPHAEASDRRSLADLKGSAPPSAATLLVGPEGGWAPEELEAARAHRWTLITLGGRTLRADAAPTVAVSALWTIWGEI